MRDSTPRELRALMAFAQQLQGIKEQFSQREWAMHEPTDFVRVLPPSATQVAVQDAAPQAGANPDRLRLSVNPSSTRR